MLVVLRSVAAAELGLTVCRALMPQLWTDRLPLGGSEVTEIGLLFVLAFVVYELADGIHHALAWWQERKLLEAAPHPNPSRFSKTPASTCRHAVGNSRRTPLSCKADAPQGDEQMPLPRNPLRKNP